MVAQPVLHRLGPPLWSSLSAAYFNFVAEMVEWILVNNYQIPDLQDYCKRPCISCTPDFDAQNLEKK